MLIYDHEKERRILERRLELLDILDSVVRRDIALGQNTDLGSPEVKHITGQFSEVLTPCDVVEAITAIYESRPHLFGN